MKMPSNTLSRYVVVCRGRSRGCTSSVTGGWYSVLVDAGKLGSFSGTRGRVQSRDSCLYVVPVCLAISSLSPEGGCSEVLHVVFLTYRLQYGVYLSCLSDLSLTMNSAIQTGTNYLVESICAERHMGEKTKTVGYQRRLTCRLSEPHTPSVVESPNDIRVCLRVPRPHLLWKVSFQGRVASSLKSGNTYIVRFDPKICNRTHQALPACRL